MGRKEHKMKRYVNEKIEVGDWDVELVQDEDGHLTIALNHADGSKVHDVGETMLESNDTEWVSRYSTEKIEKDYQEEERADYVAQVNGLVRNKLGPTAMKALKPDSEGTCPFCGKKGKEGEGCPTCPGCWYSNDPVDFETDPDPDCADLDTKLDEDWLSGMPLE